ncbi:MAG: hypothetical protein RLZZ535_2322, partial [Cyanobacteriota bacterium]
MLLTNTQNNTDIALIVSRSRYLAERLSSSVTTTDSIGSKNEAKITKRLEQWCQIVAQGNFTKFEKRLAWAGLDMKTIRPLLVDNDRHLPQPLPPWATTLAQVIEKAQTLSHEQRLAPQRYLDIKEPIPFEQIYLPCLQVARNLLVKRVSGVKILADSVQAALERQLLSQLSDVCTATLMTEFSAFRSSGNTTRDFILFNIINCNHQEKYYAFIQQLFADGLLSLFQKYSVLGRLVASTINLWVDATGEFIEHLATDWSQIGQSFSAQQPLKQVVEIKSGLSDPHNGGRTVIILTFDTGMKLVYKPKNLRIEATFSQLLDWLNRQEQLLSFKVIQVLNYDTHGWVEYVESLPCKQEAEAQRFYQRSGMLLCLIHLIEGTDCHYDNLIANGEHPVLIDTETLFHHHHKISESIDGVESQVLAKQKLTESPLRTLMLPQWGLSTQDDLNIDLSGLGGREEQVGSALKWKNINTDSMKSEA